MRRIILPLTLFFILITSQSVNAQLALSGGMYDHTIPQITYSPQVGFTWATTSDPLNYGGSRISSGSTTSTNPSISFNIFGDGFVLYIITNNTGANADLCINSVCSVISYYSASLAYTTISVNGLGYGIHNILIQKTSTTVSFINLDAIYVYPPALPPTSIPVINITFVLPTAQPTPTGTQGVWVLNLPEETPESTPEHQQPLTIGGQATIVNYEINPLDVVLVIFVAFGVFILCVGFVVNTWGKK